MSAEDKEKFDCDIEPSGEQMKWRVTYSSSAEFARIREMAARIDSLSTTNLDHLFPKKISKFEAALDKLFREYWRLTGYEPGDLTGSPSIEKPPGHRLIMLLQSILPKSTFERIYGQMIADSRQEFYDALDKGDEAEAKKIKRQLNIDLLISVFSFIAGLPMHLLMKPFKLFDKGE